MFCSLLLFGGIQNGGGLRTENRNPERRSSVFLMESQRGRDVGLGFFVMSRPLLVSEEMSVWSSLEVCHHQGSAMSLCRNLRSCPTVTVSLLQTRRVSKTYLLLETVQQRPCGWVGRCYRHLQAWTERPEECRTADAEEMVTNGEDSWFLAQHPLPWLLTKSSECPL